MAKHRKSRDTSPPAAVTGSVAAGRTWWRHWRLLAICSLVLAAYSNSFQGALVFDNASVIGQDPRIRQATHESIESILTGGYAYVNAATGLYRPFTTLSYLLNYAVLGGGPRPVGYHWVNLVLHEVNLALVYALGMLIFGETAPALALAAIWGLHPLLTESVTNIVGRADLLAALGVLAGLLCHVRGASAAGRRGTAWLAGLAAAQTVALFSKESGVVLPGLMLLYDLTWRDRTMWRRCAASYVAVAIPFAVFFSLRGALGMHMLIDQAENPLVSTGFFTARLTAVKVVGKLLWLFLWPARLSADYSYNAVPLFGWRLTNWEDAKALIALALLLGAALLALLLAVRWRRTGKPILFFLVFFFVALSPTSNLVVLIGSIMAERFLYLPSVGLAGCIVAAAYVLGRRRSLQQRAVAPVGWVALGLVCLAFTARTYARNLDWQDGMSLWTSAVEVCPGSARPHFNLAKELEAIPGRLSEAIAEYREAVRIDPDRADAHDNLGNALSGIPGRLTEAVAEFREAVRLQSDRAEAHNDLANALARKPDGLPETIGEYRAALRIEPRNAEVHYNLANALVRMPDKLPEAITEYQAALRIQPDHADAHNNLGEALSGIPGRLPEAIAEYRAALRIQPDLVAAHNNLGNALSGMPGRMPEAIAEYHAALRIQPERAETHYNLGNALAGMPGRLPDAIAEFKAAVRSEPDFVEAHVSLGKAFALTPERRADAIAEYEAALRIRPDPEVRRTLERLRASLQ
uniref:Tetratricopeptide TPR_2 repeat protein n=1 Tax=Solibacter usitatus (strain Ellin6076) TaxID=234267 RepID=Q01RN0_SOLUE